VTLTDENGEIKKTEILFSIQNLKTIQEESKSSSNINNKEEQEIKIFKSCE
jgi:hypothetical protein